MAKAETDISNQIAVDLSPLGVALFKNVRGRFLTMDGVRHVDAGLQPNGSSDLIGYTKVRITPDMVGQEIAVFTAIEVKTATGAVKPHQQKYCDNVQKFGGFAGIARSTADAKKICKL